MILHEDQRLVILAPRDLVPRSSNPDVCCATFRTSTSCNGRYPVAQWSEFEVSGLESDLASGFAGLAASGNG